MHIHYPTRRLFFSLLTILGLQNGLAQDWPDLEHFREANEALPPPGPDEDRVVFMGNSITIGWLHAVPEFFENKPYVNRGISGQTTPQMLLRFRQDVLDLNPKVVVILAGTNDIAGNTGPMTLQQILDNLKSMAELALANGVEPVLSSVLPAYDYPWRPGLEPNVKIPRLNAMIKNYADLSGIVYLDYFSVMADSRNGLDKTLATDEVHPTVKGYQIMGPLVEAAIDKALARRAGR
ncbi:SGNH/GDSL hydrolase family protein [Robiginitalea sp. SC105]|uniref:SGNH/GDSL hydrolase family protein n=1 Tax=Robiginitalea sp. SC105 TaxID=2762332 RepID=UPI00163ADA8B|nr:SGNH/GDSL hydrolase family protein [Robiginitalea sp. SC105]MBC2840654.1 SGNH/GDSL hydrolase family protein [Robiginitalea sp. SC105]